MGVGLNFWQRLAELNPSAENRRLYYVPYDQLHDQGYPEPPQERAILLIENPHKAARRPYHRQKLAWVLCHQRQFALEQASKGVHVEYRVGQYASVLQGRACTMQAAAEYELRQELSPLVQAGSLRVVPHRGWLTQSTDLPSGPPWRMDAFYRGVRQRTGILMEGGRPVGGKYSFDSENRRPWKGDPPAPVPPQYPLCPLRQEVGSLIEERFASHPGQLDLTRIPLTQDQIQHFWSWAQSQCLPHFGPYEDAMSGHSSGLFHTRLSPLINLHRLMPQRVLQDVLKLDLPLPCKEGFVRQILGWREFVHHIHEATEGFRTLAMPYPGRFPLPAAFWGKPSGLACLDRVVQDVWREGWSHHITRLMILCNLATLLEVSARELSDWFWVAYIDAFDWVVEPNVLGMGTFSLGPVMTTKPYISGSAYIDRMSDYCGSCQFHPKRDCPVTRLYWHYLGRHHQSLADNPRMGIVLKAWQKRSPADRLEDVRVFEEWTARLQAGLES